ncbi:MAG: glycosyltransferase family 39 protein [Nitrospinota bacterium]|nr:glycosyltransferase family 39 protein [Nitrospinota bacterium]
MRDSDMFFFDQWGRELANGDWLTDQQLHPMHLWHMALAKRYFALRPDKAATYREEEAATGTAADKLLWNDWLGGKMFHQEPLYAYLIGGAYRIFGPNPRVVLVWQMALGVSATLMIYFISLRIFGPVTASVAGIMALLSGALTWHEVMLLRTTLTIFVSVGLVWLALVAGEKKKMGWYAAFGFAGGASLAVLSYFIVMAGMIFLWLLWPLRNIPRQAGYAAAIMVTSGVIALSPVIARNLTVGAPPLALLSQGWIFFIIANAPDLNPSSPVNLISPYISSVLSVTDGEAVPTILETIKLHDSLFGYILFLAHKFLIVFTPYPVSDNGLGYSYFAHHSTSLSIARFHFALLAPLAFLGLFAARHRLFGMAPLLAVMIMPILLMTAFITLTRYRAPMEAAMIPLAAFGFVWLFSRRHGAIIAPIALALFSLFGPAPPPVHYKDYSFAAHIFFTPKITAATGEGKWKEAVRIYEEWFRYEDNFGISPGVLRGHQRQIASLYVRKSLAYAEALKNAGEAERARKVADRANSLLYALGMNNL